MVVRRQRVKQPGQCYLIYSAPVSLALKFFPLLHDLKALYDGVIFSGEGVDMERLSCLRHCSTSRKVAGSISDEIIHYLNRSGPIMTVWSSPSVTETSIRDIPWGARAAGTCA